MSKRHVAGRRLAASALVILAAVAMLSTPTHAISFQIVKTFDAPLIGTASFQFTIEKFTLGVWIEIPCVDSVGSCNYLFSDLPTGTSIVLADSADASWLTNGKYSIKELPPPGWLLDSVATTGISSSTFDRSQGRVEFTLDLSELDEGRLTLHNALVPIPGTLALLSVGLVTLQIISRRRATALHPPFVGQSRSAHARPQ
jgi:hypothetical protein